MKVTTLTKTDITHLLALVKTYVKDNKLIIVKSNGGVIFNDNPSYLDKLLKRGEEVEFTIILREIVINLMEKKKNSDAFAIIMSTLNPLFDNFINTGNKSDAIRRLYLTHLTEEAPVLNINTGKGQVYQLDTSVVRVQNFDNGQTIVSGRPIASEFVIDNTKANANTIAHILNTGSGVLIQK